MTKVHVSADSFSARLPPAEAGFFSRQGSRPRFGWLHRPHAPMNGMGVVIVPPFGYEAICAQRALRHLAEDAAQAGMVAVRVDLDGSGNSAGDGLDPDRLDAWLASIDDACSLARGAGAQQIVLVGVRLGVTLATLAAARSRDINGIIAIAAVPSGRAWLREAHVLQMALGLAPPPFAVSDDVQELVGFALTAQTREALGKIDLLNLAQAPASSMLLIDRDDLPANDAWAAQLKSLGVDVEQRRLRGYVDMMLDPHHAQVPQAIIDAAIGFASTLTARVLHQGTPQEFLTIAQRSEALHAETPIVEDVVVVDDHLFAIATRPAEAPRRAVILLNAGAVGHIGPNRLHVSLARRLAAAGDLVLRLDVSGIGDSRTRGGDDEENIVYSTHAVKDVGIAVDWVRGFGVSEVAVVGLCSGAYHALKAALAEQAINTVIAINPLTFRYKPGMSLDSADFRLAADAMRYQKSISRRDSWKRLLRGEVNFARVGKVLFYRARAAMARPLREVLRRLRVPLADDLGSELDALARRDIALRFIFAADDPGRKVLEEQAGSVLPKLVSSGRLSITVIAGADHTFTPRWSHPVLLDEISKALER